MICAAWPTLAESVRADVLAMVVSARQIDREASAPVGSIVDHLDVLNVARSRRSRSAGRRVE